MVSADNRTGETHDMAVRDRLLDAAEVLFSEHGYEGTSIRDMAAAAGCNVASVNYYFGGKENLYVEVWRRNLALMRDSRLASIRKALSQPDGTPRLEDLLRSFANAFIEPLVDERRARRLMKLMAREMLDQRLPARMFVEEMVAPTLAAMREALRITCPGIEESITPLVVISITGQLIQAVHAKAIFDRADAAELPKLDLSKLIEHIVAFSAAGIRAAAGDKDR